MNRDELFARAALAGQRRRDRHVLNLGTVRAHDLIPPDRSCGGTNAERGTNAAPLTPRATPAGPGRATSEPGLGGAQALRAGLTEGREAA